MRMLKKIDVLIERTSATVSGFSLRMQHTRDAGGGLKMKKLSTGKRSCPRGTLTQNEEEEVY